MVVLGIILGISGFIGYIACLAIDTHFEYTSYPEEEQYKIDKITRAARTVSRLCIAAFTVGLIIFSAFSGLFGN